MCVADCILIITFNIRCLCFVSCLFDGKNEDTQQYWMKNWMFSRSPIGKTTFASNFAWLCKCRLSNVVKTAVSHYDFLWLEFGFGICFCCDCICLWCMCVSLIVHFCSLHLPSNRCAFELFFRNLKSTRRFFSFYCQSFSFSPRVFGFFYLCCFLCCIYVIRRCFFTACFPTVRLKHIQFMCSVYMSEYKHLHVYFFSEHVNCVSVYALRVIRDRFILVLTNLHSECKFWNAVLRRRDCWLGVCYCDLLLARWLLFSSHLATLQIEINEKCSTQHDSTFYCLFYGMGIHLTFIVAHFIWHYIDS